MLSVMVYIGDCCSSQENYLPSYGGNNYMYSCCENGRVGSSFLRYAFNYWAPKLYSGEPDFQKH